MAKIGKVSVELNTEKVMKKIEEEIKKKAQELLKKEKKIQLEKIAFSLFTMFYYKHLFSYEESESLIKARIIEMRNLWVLGKFKNKLKRFYDLAKYFNEVNLNIEDIDILKENKNGN